MVVAIMTAVIMAVGISANADVNQPSVTISYVDILSEASGARGTSAPKEKHDFSKGSYGMTGSFAYKAYTGKLFPVEDEQDLNVNLTIDYQNIDEFALQKKLTVELYKKGTFSSTKVNTASVNSTKLSDGMYSASLHINKTFSDLAEGNYYMVIIKTNDTYYADIDGTVSLKK